MPFTFLKASSVYPFPTFPASFPGENLDHVDRTTTALVASFSSWRRCLGSFVGGGLCSPRGASASAPAFASFHLHRPDRAWSSASLRWRMLCRHSNLADALPLSSRWLKFGQIAVVGCSGGCLATFVRLLTFAPGRFFFLLAGSVHYYRFGLLSQFQTGFYPDFGTGTWLRGQKP